MSRGGIAKLLSAPSDAQSGNPSGCSEPVAGDSVESDFPELIGRYRRDRKLGRGGMGVVFRYRDSKLDRFVAVKSLVARGQLTFDSTQRDNIMREAKNLAALAHPNIGAIHDVIEHDGADYLLLEYVPGGTLAQEIRSGRLDLNRALSVALQIAQAIEAGHEAGIVHGDIKPGNIMITPSSVAKLLDYGLARKHMRVVRADEEPGTTASVDLSAIIVGEPAMGTPGYMSPELLCGSPMHRSADIWAFGCVLFECLTGEAAFSGATPQERIAATINSQPRIDSIATGTPAIVIDLVKKCLSKSPDQRPRQMSDVCVVLRAALQPQADASSRSTIPSNIPAQVSSFVDRQGEMPKLLTLLERARLLTLIGPGGCGKTRLSQELARCALHEDSIPSSGSKRFDAVWFIELASLTSGDLVPRAIASVVCSAESLKNKGDQTLMQTIIESLRDQRALLVLDNCEHLVDGAASIARELLARCANLKIVATSRAALHVVGGASMPITCRRCRIRAESRDGLSEFEAVRLFVDRARQARNGFELTERNSTAVAEICRRLEGIPLAIELAAARVTSMPVDDLAKRLFDVLDPKRVLETSIQWSVDLLSPPERTLLGRLSVFRGGWTLEAAEAVCGDGETRAIDAKPVVELLTQLIDESLVLYEEREDRARYQMLETVREFAQQQLLKRADAQDEIDERHFGYFSGLASEVDASLSGLDQDGWFQRLDVEHDNLRAAMTRRSFTEIDIERSAVFVRDLRQFWLRRGHFEEGRACIEQVLQRRGAVLDLLQSQLLNAVGIIAAQQSDFTAAVNSCRQALSITQATGDVARTAGVLTNLGIWTLQMGDVASSRAFHDQARRLYVELGDSVGLAIANLSLGDVSLAEHRLVPARELIKSALVVFESNGDRQRVAAALHNLGQIEFHSSDPECARRLFSRSLAIRITLNDRSAMIRSLRWLAVSLCATGDYRQAARSLGAAEAIAIDTHLDMRGADSLFSRSAEERMRDCLEPTALASERQYGRALARKRILSVESLMADSVIQ